MAQGPEPVVRLRIDVERPVPGVTLRLQRGRDALVEPVRSTPDRITFECDARVGVRNGQPNFLGEFTQGPADARFLYINSGSYAAQVDTRWSRRAKIPLSGISRKQVDAAVRSGGVLAVRIEGTGRDGGPCSATVEPLDDGWRVEPK